MNARKSLRKPANWQDFESLCKKLWGEIWNCPEIKKNGRSGQVQRGVDIYGVPDKKDNYWGIQCKAKDEDINAKLTQAMVDEEIEQAKDFEPSLEKLYIATTANKDVNIETYVRKKDLESRRQGGFEIHLFCWEDIVELIDENKITHDWYIKASGFKEHTSVDVQLIPSTSLQLVILKSKKVKIHTTKAPPALKIPNHLKQAIAVQQNMLRYAAPLREYTRMHERKLNRSYVYFKLQIHNNGTVPLSNCKLRIDLSANLGSLDFGRKYDREFPIFSKPTFRITKNAQRVWELRPAIDSLVPTDIFLFQEFSFRPTDDAGAIRINWQFLSAELQTEGTIELPFVTEYHISREYIVVDAVEQESRAEMIEDYFETESDDNE